MVLILLTVSVLFQSCATSELENEETNSFDLSKIESLKTMDENSQRVDFNFLNSEEKYFFRSLIIDEYIENTVFNEAQMNSMNELKNIFNSEIYSSKDEKEIFLNITIGNWSKEALKVFSLEEIYNFAVKSYGSEKAEIPNVLSRSLDQCTCHLNSIFKCTKEVTLTVPPSIKVVDCKSKNCEKSVKEFTNEEETGGCGWFGLQSCNGGC